MGGWLALVLRLYFILYFINKYSNKFLISGADLDAARASGPTPSAVTTGSTRDAVAQRAPDRAFACPRCQGNALPIDGRPATDITVGDCTLVIKYVNSASGGCTEAIIARGRAAWDKLNKLLPILTPRHHSFF